jgi:hypothetical protein
VRAPRQLLLAHPLGTVKDLENHSKIALGAEVRHLDAAELAAKDQFVPSFGLCRQRLVEVRSSDGDVVQAPALHVLALPTLIEYRLVRR